jgi:CHC2 zinc finger
MAVLLHALGFEMNKRTRRCACVLHGGSNPSAFSWREDGHWHCFSCCKGGDKIALVREARQCSFCEALQFLASLAGVSGRSRWVSHAEVERRKRLRERAGVAAWRIRDEAVRLRSYYAAALLRSERLMARIDERLRRETNSERIAAGWTTLTRIAPVCTYFLAAFNWTWDAPADLIARFALAAPADRRRMILEWDGDERQTAA